MVTDTFRRLLFFAVLCLAHALVLGHIHLFGCATPLLYVYIVLLFPRDYPRWAILLWSFAMGVVIDIFSDTPGVASASLTLVGAVQPQFFGLFVQRDSPDSMRPSMRAVGAGKFAFYVFALTLFYCTVFFSLEMFSFFNWLHWLECVGGSTVLTFVLILTLESARRK